MRNKSKTTINNLHNNQNHKNPPTYFTNQLIKISFNNNVF